LTYRIPTPQLVRSLALFTLLSGLAAPIARSQEVAPAGFAAPPAPAAVYPQFSSSPPGSQAEFRRVAARPVYQPAQLEYQQQTQAAYPQTQPAYPQPMTSAFPRQTQPMYSQTQPAYPRQPQSQPQRSGDPYGFTAWLNGVRAQHGLGPVGFDPNLSGWASANNGQQQARGMGHHVMGPARRQNSGMGNFSTVTSMWMASPAHQSALLDPSITWVGIAGLGAYWTYNAY